MSIPFESNHKSKSEFQMGLIGAHEKILSDALTYVDRNNRILSQILTTLNQPLFNRSTLSADQNYLLNHTINDLLNSGTIRKSESPYSSPVRAQYIGDKIILDVDYGLLNAHTINRNYPLPTPQSVLLSINESNLFTKIVLKDPYHQLGLTHDSIGKTAFATGEFNFFEIVILKFHHHQRTRSSKLEFLTITN